VNRPESPRVASLIATLAVLVACQSSGAPAQSASVSPGPEGTSVAAVDCEPIDLRTPTGDRVDLTGTWEGGVMVHHIRQEDECVWWIAYSTWPGTDLGEIGNLVFLGKLAPDFTLSGRFTPIVMSDQADIYGLPQQGRTLKFTVEFDEAGQPTRLVRDAPLQTDPPLQYFDELTFVGPLPEPADPPQQ
jgi:hypothetical protein